jgi:hypothetical protein
MWWSFLGGDWKRWMWRIILWLGRYDFMRDYVNFSFSREFVPHTMYLTRTSTPHSIAHCFGISDRSAYFERRSLTMFVLSSTHSMTESQIVVRRPQPLMLMILAIFPRLKELSHFPTLHPTVQLRTDICENVLEELARIIFSPQAAECLAILDIDDDIAA